MNNNAKYSFNYTFSAGKRDREPQRENRAKQV